MPYFKKLGYSGEGPRTYQPTAWSKNIPLLKRENSAKLKPIMDSYLRDIAGINDNNALKALIAQSNSEF